MAGRPTLGPGFSTTAQRDAKAQKILAVLAKAGFPLTGEHRVLDLGTGSGEIARNLAQTAKLIACDVIDQRQSKDGPPFVLGNQSLPFADLSFDVVISNHVIEHTPDPCEHLREIYRILKPSGIVYLATPNRLWPREFHTRLMWLHYLPAALFRKISARTQRGDELLLLQTTRSLKRHCAGKWTIDYRHHLLLRDSEHYALSLPDWARTLVPLMPNWVLGATRALQPTLICLLRPR